ncbi:MAG: MFS transporter, partial [Deltaproteobacteria bacterium]|nr:MFS transporter [Deltaproteobacteria bacterium]
MPPDSLLKKPKFFYGYWIVATAFFCAFINSGIGFYAFSLFVKPLQDEFGWGRGQIMVAVSIFFSIGGISAPIVGRLVDRFGARRVMSIGAAITVCGFITLSTTRFLWAFYAGYVIAGLGMAGAGMVPGTTLVSNWFNKRRGTAVGVMSGGLGAGGLVFAPLIGAFLIPNFGWRTSYLVMSMATAIIIPLALFIIKTRPEDMGLFPDGVPAPPPETTSGTSTSPTPGPGLKMALTTSGFWLMAVSFMAHGFCEVGILQTQIPYLRDLGFPMAKASAAFGVVGFFSFTGKIFFGWLCDRIKAKYACAIGLTVELIGILILYFTRLASPEAMLWIYAVIMGLGVGSWLPTMSMLVSTNYGLAAYGSIYGMISLTMSIGAATGPLTSGFIYDLTGNYNWAFIIFIVLYL